MIKGSIKFYNQEKGFGFITPDGGGADIFVPAATLSTSKISSLKTGQRVRFEIQADKKGLKAARVLVDADKPREEQPTQATLTVYYDPSAEHSADILAVLKAIGEDVVLVDCVKSVPSRDQMQRLSNLLRDGQQSFVRRYHPLFLALRLDDRFIGESEFWTAVTEHPQLINGPILATNSRARVCKTEGEVRSFLGNEGDQEKQPKAISPRILAMIKGESVEPRPERAGAVVALEENADIGNPIKPKPKKKAMPRLAAKQQKKRTPPPRKASNAKSIRKGNARTKKVGGKKRK
jgi:cold shock protein